MRASIGMQELGDSLTVYTGFSSLWSPAVRVKNMRVSGNNVTIRTNLTLKDVRWTPARINDIKHKVSNWVLGHENGNITIISGRTDIEELLTPCAKGIMVHGKQADLTNRTIALYPSHGLYHNTERDEWIWQRATLWTTVEDLYSQEYVRLIRRMLENAGATVVSPRPGIEEQELGASGMPQWTEAARYWLIKQGADTAIWNLYDGNEYKDDMKCRALWVNSLEEPVDLCIALHTDGIDSGDDSTIVGTLVIYTARDDEGQPTLRDGRDREKTNRNLADWIQTQITEDLRHWNASWTRRQLKEANYCETRVPTIPSIILELLSHKNMADMRYGLDPKFRFAAARAVYKGILRYLNGSSAVVQPLPIEQLSISTDGWLRWATPVDSIDPDAVPSYYMVYTQADEGDWNIQQVDGATQVQLDIQPGIRYNCYVVAGNEGGLSPASPVVSVYRSELADAPSVLVIDAFDDSYGPEWFADSTYAGIQPGTYACENYFTCAYIGEQWDFLRASQWTNDDNCGWGACYRDHAGQMTVGNTHDWSVLHGRVLSRMHISYASCTAGMASEFQTQLSAFNAIDYVCGRQRKPVSSSMEALLSAYLNQGGRLLLSTDHFSAINPLWAKQFLHASYYASHATRNGRIIRPHHKPDKLQLTPNDEQLFTCTPEGLKAETEQAVRMAEYQDMRCPAAVGVAQKSLVYGFPLEAVQDFNSIYRHSIEWLLIDE